MTDNNFASRRFQGTHDSEAGPSTTHINEIAHDSTDAEIPYVSTMATTNAASCRNEELRNIFRAKHNIARNFFNNATMIRSQLPAPSTCRLCNARLFYNESGNFCCIGGKVSFPQVNAPQQLLEIFSDSSSEGRHFRQYIRSYNHVFSFTSMGVHVDENVAATGGDILECSLIIKERPANQPQYNLPTASQVAGIIVAGDMESRARGRDIKVVDHDGDITSIQETKGYYDPLQYPLLFPFGTYGWDIHTNNNRGRNVSCREYYSYMLQIRPNDQSTLLRAGRLLQQYVVDNYVKIESGRLRWIRTHQNDIRAEVYQGLQDALHVGEITTERSTSYKVFVQRDSRALLLAQEGKGMVPKKVK
ncbi:Helitron helicase-like domain [Sesbania bispinosa]|nr:Helitron helicase-like domain [Sesbania bispinosa]